MSDKEETPSEFEQAAEEGQVGFFREFWWFLRDNKLWWITPIVIVLLIFGVIAAFGSSGLMPFVYTIF
jgi:drug/metabolite transporter superfamily protein YnfA